MDGMPHPDHQMTQWKRILLCWDVMEGSDVQGLGQMIELTMYAWVLPVAVHAYMLKWNIGIWDRNLWNQYI